MHVCWSLFLGRTRNRRRRLYSSTSYCSLFLSAEFQSNRVIGAMLKAVVEETWPTRISKHQLYEARQERHMIMYTGHDIEATQVASKLPIFFRGLMLCLSNPFWSPGRYAQFLLALHQLETATTAWREHQRSPYMLLSID